jgi:putative transposase
VACLTTDWALGGFAKTKNLAQQRYRDFVQQNKGQPSPWRSFKNQIYPGDDEFVLDMLCKLAPEQSLKTKASTDKTIGLLCQFGKHAK